MVVGTVPAENMGRGVRGWIVVGVPIDLAPVFIHSLLWIGVLGDDFASLHR